MSKTPVAYEAAWIRERDEYLEELHNDLKRLSESGVLEGKRIAIAGCWTNAGEVKKILGGLGLSISIIADNNPKKQGVSRVGIIAQSVTSLADERNIVILLLNTLNNYYWYALRNQLNELGFVRDVDYFIVFGGEKNRQKADPDSLAVSDALWDKWSGYAEKGYASYMEVTRQHPGLPIWFLGYPSLGDVYIFSLYLPFAMGVRSVAECEGVLIVSKNSVKKLAEALGFRRVLLIPLEEAILHWVYAMRLMGDKLTKLQNGVYHALNSHFQYLAGNTDVNFRDSFTRYIFNFQEEVRPAYPQLPGRRDVVLAMFEKLNLKPGKTVLISPYAGHFEAAVAPDQWGRLVKALLDNGYCVCTNCGGPNEPPLPGTVPVFVELRDCVEFAETAGYFVGVRSGFCDLLCMARCLKVVIYETGAHSASKEFFGFDSMGLGDGNIIELLNDCIHTDELLDSIAERFSRAASE